MVRRGEHVPVYHVPDSVLYLLGWFWTLDSHREMRGESPGPIPPERIESWARLRGIQIRPWEYGLLEDMDFARLSGPAEMAEKARLNTDAFDEMFG